MSHIQPVSAATFRQAGLVRYPDAPRLPISEQIGGRWIDDPYRWLEDPSDPQTVAWSGGAGRAGARRAGRVSRPDSAGRAAAGAAAGRPRGPAAAPRRGRIPAPAGTRTSSMRSWSWASSDRSARIPDARRSAAARPHRRDDARRLGAVPGRPAARLPALQRRRRGVRALRAGRRDRARSSTARSTAPATPRSPGCRRERLLLRAAAARRQPVRPPGVPAPARRGSGAATTTSSATGSDPRTYFGVDVSPDGRWLVVSARDRHRPARRRLDRRPDAIPAGLRRRAGGGRRALPRLGRLRRAALHLDRRARPRAAGCASPTRRIRSAGRTLVAEDAGSGARRLRGPATSEIAAGVLTPCRSSEVRARLAGDR